jgi:hypothetical protein
MCIFNLINLENSQRLKSYQDKIAEYFITSEFHNPVEISLSKAFCIKIEIFEKNVVNLKLVI